MQSNLGLYIEDNLIKYAKVSKDKDKMKIDAFGIKFFSNIDQAINQIIEETDSYKVPISINLKDENYQYFNMFAGLNKADIDKAIKLEFDAYCSERGYNANSLETRYVAVNSSESQEKLKIINISENKMELTKSTKRIDGYKLSAIVPIALTIPNIINLQPKENVLIVNIENKTTITTIIDQNICDVNVLDEGSNEVLAKINEKENSMSKTYEILQNTTIYTADSQDFTEEQSRYLEDIMPTLYNIVGQTQKIINESLEPITKVYITGTLACVNNIDLYFQEYLGKVRCEILKPSIVQKLSQEVNVKEYVEVNSAIALAMQGLGEGIKGINFKKNNLDALLKLEIGGAKDVRKKGTKSKSKKKSYDFNDFREKLSRGEIGVLRLTIALTIFIVIYSAFSILLTKQIHDKETEVAEVKSEINSQISQIQADTAILNNKATQYGTLVSDLQEVNQKRSDINASKNLIPNLLNQIMTVIDETVQLTSIENTTDKHIVITAQSPRYPGLGYFKTKLKTQNILKNVISGSSMKQDDMIIVTIEGDLP